MKKVNKVASSLKQILTVIFVLLAASNAALAAESSDYINELMVSDFFSSARRTCFS